MLKSLLLAATLITTPLCADDPVRQDPNSIDDASPPGILELSIMSDGSRMGGFMYKANGPGPHPTAILLHGFPGNERNLDVAQSLRRAGFNVIFYHYRGAWSSEGEYSVTNQLADTQEIVRQIRAGKFPHADLIDKDRLHLVGHSLGGFGAIKGAMENSAIKCTVAMAPVDLGGVVALMKQQGRPLKAPAYDYHIDGIAPYRLNDLLAESAANQEDWSLSKQGAKLTGRPVMIFAATRDTVVPAAGVRALSSFLKDHSNFTFRELDTDHSFNWKRIELQQEITSWMVENCT